MSAQSTTSDPHLVNGVFQGGGAKGLAYGGALRAVAARGIWFGSVAGTSAGSITASLIAAGLRPETFDELTDQALNAARSPIPQRLALAALGRATSVFQAEPLRRWLDATYAEAIGHDPADGPVTFEQLYRATRIELYVVSLDLATEWPVVFSRRTTPHVDVAGAVAASSAIPLAFPAGRSVVRSEIGGARVHQLMDGAGWANYPSFVFDDESFRAWVHAESSRLDVNAAAEHDAWEQESQRPILGFVLGATDPPSPFDHTGFVPLDGPPIDRRFDLGPASTSSGRVTHLIGAVLSSDWARLTIALALAIWVSLSVATMPIAFRRFSTWLADWMPDPLFPIALVGGLTVAVLAVVTSIIVLSALVFASRLLADTVIPALTTVIGTPSEVPPWLGLDGPAVVLRVPRDGLSTVNFDVAPDVRQAAVDAAHESVTEQLAGDAGRRLDQLLAGETPGPAALPDRHLTAPEPDARATGASDLLPTLAVVVLTTLVGGVAWWVTTAGSSAGIGWIVAGTLATLVAVGATTAFVSERTARRAHDRAGSGVTDTSPARRRRLDPRLELAAGALLVIGGVVLATLAMNDRNGDTVVAEVITATESDSGNAYVMRSVDDGARYTVASERHLRLGERSFLDTDEGSDDATIAGPLDDVRFGISVVLIALGVGAAVAAVRTRRWLTRADRLHELTTARAVATNRRGADA